MKHAVETVRAGRIRRGQPCLPQRIGRAGVFQPGGDAYKGGGPALIFGLAKDELAGQVALHQSWRQPPCLKQRVLGLGDIAQADKRFIASHACNSGTLGASASPSRAHSTPRT